MFSRINKAIEVVLAVFAGVGLFVMMCLTAVDVIGRYGFNKSVFGSAEYTEILMVGIIFAGIALISASNEHITVTIFDDWIQRHAPGLQRWIVLLFMLTVYILITFQLYRTGFNAFESGKMTPVVGLPQWIIPMGAAALSTLGIALYVISMIHNRGQLGRRQGGLIKTASSHDSGGK